MSDTRAMQSAAQSAAISELPRATDDWFRRRNSASAESPSSRPSTDSAMMSSAIMSVNRQGGPGRAGP
eukprot:CAMPEP_0206317286 /NCGR_PEP_ID=MMETSP0106_2-20121207/16556_1 /ASSEMBLY_ACC=CAM_ASM_000206 /TAXON_ID=81532 /ORGANISM="Acanthoeca-like sp., Strain 10tr" /LENGTH=67 /DNA_ID=CAMNT_0053748871 /DNA_START=92 /DNA_END=292 /DNA_ORIENTATION=+